MLMPGVISYIKSIKLITVYIYICISGISPPKAHIIKDAAILGIV